LTGATLATFSDAAALYDYTSQRMPINAPGSLSETEYYQVLAFILDQTGSLPPDEPLGSENAPQIELTP
jgi:cytochrome c